MGLKTIAAGLAASMALAAPAHAVVGYADVVLDYFNSGLGSFPGPYGGTFDGISGSFPVPVSTSVVLGPDCHRLEQRIADVVPKGVVDDLESVEVEEQDRHQAINALGVGQRLLQSFEQQHAVGQAGEHVVVGKVTQSLLRLLALGDVLDDGDEHRRVFLAHEL